MRPVLAVDRSGARDEANVAAVRGARFVYLSDGLPLHLRSVPMHSPLWDALVAAWQGGAVLAGSGAGAMVLCDPAVDPRGGAFTLGLGLLDRLAVVPRPTRGPRTSCTAPSSSPRRAWPWSRWTSARP